MSDLGGPRIRASWLGRPWFFAAVAALALNDHVLKAAWPGWFTGKLSDFAGLVVVATLASVVAGPNAGCVLAGVGFVLLKTVPGVAETVAPALGGVTLRDATDVLAVVVLPLVWRALRARPNRSRVRRGWAAVGLVAAVLATTATSSHGDPQVSLGSAPGVIYAWVNPSDGFDRVMLASGDGGRTWMPAPNVTDQSTAVNWATTSDPKDRGKDEVCGPDATCFRVGADATYRLGVERSVAGSQWQLDGTLGPYGYGADIAVDPADPARVVAVGSDATIYYRRTAGDWVGVDLEPLVARPPWLQQLVGFVGGPGLPVLTAIVCGVLIGLLVPWASVRWALHISNLILCAAFFPLGLLMLVGHWTWGVVRLNGGWLAVVVVLVLLMRGTMWLERRAALRPAWPAGWATRRTGWVFGVGSIVAIIASLVLSAGPLALAAALSVFGWVVLPSLSTKWLVQVLTLFFCALAVFAGTPLGHAYLGVAAAPAGVVWATATVTAVVSTRWVSGRRGGTQSRQEDPADGVAPDA